MIVEITIFLVLLCWAFGAASNAVMDVLAFKYKKSIFKKFNPDFWNPAISWRNKYKNKNDKDGPAFFGSTTFLVFTTDAWHLFQFLSNSFLALSVVVVFHPFYKQNIWLDLALFIVLKITWGVVFQPLYGKFFRTKPKKS